jgi:hypothetical protein
MANASVPAQFCLDPDGSVRDARGVVVGELEGESMAGIVARALGSGARPRSLAFRFSNACPMRCRACGPSESSTWAGDWPELERTGRDFYRRPPGTPPYGLRRLSGEAFARLLSESPAFWSELEWIEILGGEPFAEPMAWQLLRHLLAAKALGEGTELRMATNALEMRPEQLAVAGAFASFRVSVGAEATGNLYRYMRGRDFTSFADGVERLRSLPRARVSIACAVSAFSVFGAADLFAWHRSLGFDEASFVATVVDRPRFLRPWSLSIHTRRRAAARMRAAGMTDAAFIGLFAELERDERSEDELRIQHYQEFVEFASDLDRARGDRLAHAAPDLVRLEDPAEGGARRGALVWPARR